MLHIGQKAPSFSLNEKKGKIMSLEIRQNCGKTQILIVSMKGITDSQWSFF